jgi:ankyrin repeat protein
MFGQSCLHLAIVHDDYETVQLLLEKGASVNARASGDFFMLENPGRNKRNLTYQGPHFVITDIDLIILLVAGYAYYGEFPLAFAACFENKDIYDILVSHFLSSRLPLTIYSVFSDPTWR